MSRNHLIPSVMRQISLAAIFVAVWALIHVKSDMDFTGYYLTLMIYAGLSMLLNYAFAGKERSMSVLIGFNLFLFLAAGAILYIQGMFISAGGTVFMAVSLIVPAYMCINVIINDLRLSSLTICLEIVLAVSVFYIAVAASDSEDLTAAVFLITAIVLNIFGLIFYRAEISKRGRSVAISLIIMILAVMAAFLIYEAVFNSSMSVWTAVWSALTSAFNYIAAAIKAFLLWIGQNIPEDSFDEIELEADGVNLSTAQLSAGSEYPLPTGALIAGLIVAAVVIVVLVIIFTRHKRFAVDKKTVSKKQLLIKSEKTGLGDAFRQMLGRIKYKKSVKRFIRQHKNDPLGQFYFLVNSVKNTKLAKKKGETPEEFISRYLASLKSSDKRKQQYKDLAEKVNLYFYSAEKF